MQRDILELPFVTQEQKVVYWEASKKEIRKLREALEFECGGRCNAEYNPCNARMVLDKNLRG